MCTCQENIYIYEYCHACVCIFTYIYIWYIYTNNWGNNETNYVDAGANLLAGRLPPHMQRQNDTLKPCSGSFPLCHHQKTSLHLGSTKVSKSIPWTTRKNTAWFTTFCWSENMKVNHHIQNQVGNHLSPCLVMPWGFAKKVDLLTKRGSSVFSTSHLVCQPVLASRQRRLRNIKYLWYSLRKTEDEWHFKAIFFRYPKKDSSEKQVIVFRGLTLVLSTNAAKWSKAWCFGLSLKSLMPFCSQQAAKCCHAHKWLRK